MIEFVGQFIMVTAVYAVALKWAINSPPSTYKGKVKSRKINICFTAISHKLPTGDV